MPQQCCHLLFLHAYTINPSLPPKSPQWFRITSWHKTWDSICIIRILLVFHHKNRYLWRTKSRKTGSHRKIKGEKAISKLSCINFALASSISPKRRYEYDLSLVHVERIIYIPIVIRKIIQFRLVNGNN